MKKLKSPLLLATLSMLALAGCGGEGASSAAPQPSSASEPTISSSEPLPSSEASSQEVSSETSSEKPIIHHKVESDTLYVKQVKNMPEDFIIGMDSSSVISLEESGVKYYDFDDNEKDLFTILAEVGVTDIRVRIWNDPFTAEGKGYGGGNVDIKRAVEIGKRVTANGLYLLPDFHYSDFWADPGRQLAPKAWEGKTLEEKQTLLYNYTLDCMNQFKEAGVAIRVAQIGNETNIGIAGEDTMEGMEKYSKLVTQGTRAVKAVYPDALTAVHFTNPEKGTYLRTARQLRQYGCEYDIFGTSYYPFYHGTLENLESQLDTIAKNYDKKVMVLETSYAYTDADFDDGGKQFPAGGLEEHYPITQAGQTNNFRNICDVIVNGVTDISGKQAGIGVCYWEGTWIAVPGSNYDERRAKWEQFGSGWACDRAGEYDPDVAKYGGGGTQVDNQCFFDSDGKPLESLKMFGLLRDGNVTPEFVDGVEDTTVIHKINESFELPGQVNAIYNSDRRDPAPVEWKSYLLDQKETIAQGGETSIDVTLSQHPIVPDSVMINSKEGLDIWEWHGEVGGDAYGTLNYETGKLNLTFVKKPTDEITISYKGYEAVEPYEESIQKIKALGPGSYTILGKCEGMDVYCSLVLDTENYISDGGFESGGKDSPWTVTNLSSVPLSATYWAKIAKENVYSDGGQYSLGWWGQEAGAVKFEATQEFTVLENDSYKLSAAILAGQKTNDAIPGSAQNNYVLISNNGEEVAKLVLEGVNYAAGWIQSKIEDIALEANVTYKVTVHVESSVLGYWGAVDALQLYR